MQFPQVATQTMEHQSWQIQFEFPKERSFHPRLPSSKPFVAVANTVGQSMNE
jgi:hypothetical protein